MKIEIGVPEVVKVPRRDRNGEFSVQVLPRRQQYEDDLRRQLCLMLLEEGSL